ncbi:carbohydrate porin [Limnohabitans sp. DCL3]|uniref:carbohydrate porin n=1 Tax=Limnohabitans sp. DCL3 TaxID=3374103 RepID=UPI003A8581BD
MQSQFRLAALAAALLAAGAAHAGVTFDANIENDTTFKGKQGTTKRDTANGGRIELNAKAELVKSGDNFVNAKASLIIPTSSTDKVGVDDAWIQFGNSAADLKIGRQEAADLFPLGKDVVVEAAASGYGYRANALRGRKGDGQLHAVAGLNAAPGLRVELGLVTEKSGKSYGVRPTVVYTAGQLTLRAGMESIKQDAYDQNTDSFVNNVWTRDTNPIAASSSTGFGVSGGYSLGQGVGLNVNYSKNSDLNATSVGLNAVIGAAGLGMVQDKTGANKATTYYAAYSFPLMGVKGASITPAISSSKATGVENLSAFKVRLNYAF